MKRQDKLRSFVLHAIFEITKNSKIHILKNVNFTHQLQQALCFVSFLRNISFLKQYYTFKWIVVICLFEFLFTFHFSKLFNYKLLKLCLYFDAFSDKNGIFNVLMQVAFNVLMQVLTIDIRISKNKMRKHKSCRDK